MAPLLFDDFFKMRTGNITEDFAFVKTLNQKRQGNDIEQGLVTGHAAGQHVRHRHQSVADDFQQLRSFIAQCAADLNRHLNFTLGCIFDPFGKFDQANALMIVRRPHGVSDPFYWRSIFFCRFGRFTAAAATCDYESEHEHAGEYKS